MKLKNQSNIQKNDNFIQRKAIFPNLTKQNLANNIKC